MGGQTAAINPGMYPMQNMSYIYQMGGMMDDIYGRQLYYQMNNGQSPYTVPQTTATNTKSGGTTQNPQASAKAGGIKPMWPALGIGAATYLAGTNLDFIKPVGEDGKFTEEYLKHFSSEYAAVKNGENINNFYKSVGKDVKPENFEGLMTELERLGLEKDPAKIAEAAKTNPVLKSFLEEKGILNTDGTLKDAQNSINQVRDEFANHKTNYNKIMSKHNYLKQSQIVERLNGLEEAWSKCTTREAQIKFFKENADIIRFNPVDFRELYFNPDVLEYNEAAVKDYIQKEAREGWTNVLKKTKTEMSDLAATWTKGEKWFNRGSFKGASEGMTKAMNTGLKSLRKSKFIPIALIATAVTWGIGKLCQ